MSKLKLNITMSLDGYVAGPGQSTEHPLGIGGERLHEWLYPLKAFREIHGEEGGEVNASTPFAEDILADAGATIMGRNMFGGGPGPWKDESWKGWWGDDPPFHHPVSLVPIFLGGGSRVFDELGDPAPSLRQVEAVGAPGVTHIRYIRAD